jgi:hypothetical protein
MRNHIGIIVDGDGDYAALRSRFISGFKIVKTDGPRGHNSRPKDIATFSQKQIRMLQALRCKEVIVVLDFEDRRQEYEAFVTDLILAFSSFKYSLPVLVVVANRMIENWYLADIEYLSTKRAFLKKGLKQKNYEGRNGKAEIKKCMKYKYSYSETRHGPQMFGILRFDIARRNSASFNTFLALAKKINLVSEK